MPYLIDLGLFEFIGRYTDLLKLQSSDSNVNKVHGTEGDGGQEQELFTHCSPPKLDSHVLALYRSWKMYEIQKKKKLLT